MALLVIMAFLKIVAKTKMPLKAIINCKSWQTVNQKGIGFYGKADSDWD